MLRVPIHIQNTQLVDNLVASKHLDRYNSSVLHEIADNLAVEDLQCSIVAGVGEKGQGAVVFDGSNGFRVESHCLVRTSRQIKIVPQKSSVIRSDNEIVTTGVDIEGGDPSSTGLDNLDKF